MKILGYIIMAVLAFIVVLLVIYFLLLFKLKNIHSKIYKYKKEEDLKQKNVLIIYQPSRHKTTSKIKDLIKEEVIDKGYGVMAHTLSRKDDEYSKYEYVIFVAPVYFGEINVEIINKVKNNKIKNLIIVYNGLNKESENEDKLVKNNSISKYKKIKVHTEDIDLVKEFIKKEVL